MSKTSREQLYRAVDFAIEVGGWRPADLEGVIRGPARYANGFYVGCCQRCGRPEYEDGLIATELIDADAGDGIPIVSGFVCPPCKLKESRGEAPDDR